MKNDKRSIGRDPHIAPGVYYIQKELCARIDGDRIIVEKKESEDERIRKEIIDYLGLVGKGHGDYAQSMIDGWIAWLEKQKKNPKSADSIPADCVLSAKCEDRWHKTSNSLPDNGRDVLAKDALGNYLLASFDGAEWFVSVYDGEDHPVLHTPPILEWCEIPSAKQKEQKPIPSEDMPYITDEHFWEREPADSFKYKLAEYMTKNCRKVESPDGYTYHISAESILKMAEEELIKRGVVQKSAEWSEEDKRAIDRACVALRAYSNGELPEFLPSELLGYADRLQSLRPQPKVEWSEKDEKQIRQIERIVKDAGGSVKLQEQIHNWFKSLRPSWKPTEEQMNSFDKVEN